MGRIERGETERKKRGDRRGRKGVERNIQKEAGGAEVMETPLPFPQEEKQFDLSHTKKQHIAKKDISHFPVEGNRVTRSGGVNLQNNGMCVRLTHSLHDWENLSLSQP